jgi:hypothetical protein
VTHGQQPPTPTIESALAKFESTIAATDEKMTRLLGAVEQAVARASSISTPLAGPLGSRLLITPLHERATQKLADLAAAWGNLRTIFVNHAASTVPVLSLVVAGFRWTEEILPGLSAMSAVARDIKGDALHAWGGPAARAYQEKRSAQGEALDSLVGAIEKTSITLLELANTNAEFLLQLTEPLLDLGEEIAEAIMELITVVGVLEAIDTVASAISRAVADVVRIEKLATQHGMVSLGRLNELLMITNNNQAMPDGRWPQAVHR